MTETEVQESRRRAANNVDHKIGIVLAALVVAIGGLTWLAISHFTMERFIGGLVVVAVIIGIGILIERADPKEFWF